MSRKLIQISFSVLLLAGMLLGFAIIDGVRSSAVAQVDPTAKLEPQVLEQLNSGNADFIIVMAEQADVNAADQLQTKVEKGQYVFDTLVATADRTQADLQAYLKNQAVDFRSFYVVNAIWVKGGSLDLALTIASRSDVSAISSNHQYQLDKPINPQPSTVSPLAVEPNISFINADDVWAMGFTGQGTVMGDNDTGVDVTHPAIAPHYRGCLNPPSCTQWDHNYNWYDAFDPGNVVPWDDYGHGTHTTGTMIGDDFAGNQIGVAPGAQTIHCKNMLGGGGDDAHFILCFEWDLAPWDLSGANPLPAMAPDAVNNSWGYFGGGVNAFRTVIDNLQAAGILVEVSAGNEGPSCTTLRSPGDYEEVLTTGSVDHTGYTYPGSITGFSSRGPSILDQGFFPDVMAPGNGIRSSLPGNTYAYWSGTSMAGPHSVGLVGLMWSACPSLVGNVAQTIEIIKETAAPLTGQGGSGCGGDYTVGPNNDWGYGTIDSLAAVQMAVATCTGVGTLQGTVTDAVTTDPLEGVTVQADWEGGFSYMDTTDAAGFYSMFVPEGNYAETASKFGYVPSTVDVVVVTDTTTTQDFALTPAVSYVVAGTVTDAETGWPLYAKISIGGYPGDPIWTNPENGTYSITLPEGIVYTFDVDAFVAGYEPQSREIGPLTGDLTEDFALLVDLASCSAPGRHPDCYWYENFESGDGGFVASGTTTFAFGMPTSGPGVAHSGNNVWATNLAGQYNNSENGYLTSPDIDLSGLAGQGVFISWWQWLVSESNYDYATVEVSNNGGASWTPIYGPLSGSIDTEWTRHDVVLDASYAVSNFRVRFHFTTDSSVTYEGWYIDDLCLNGVEPPVELYTQNFDAGNGGFTHYGALDSWAWGAPTSGPGVAHSAPNVWATNLAGNYNTDESSYVESPDIDLTAASGMSISLSWWQWLQTESCCDYGSVEVSNDGGASWTTVYGPAYGDVDMSWAKHTVVLNSSYAVSNFRMRFYLYTDYSVEYPGYYVDDISLSYVEGAEIPCVADPGGLVVGNVYDDNTDLPLVGALVMMDSGASYVTVETPADPNVDDGFYTLFGSEGLHDLTASMDGYGDDVEAVDLILGGTVLQNFFLGTGFLDPDPNSLHATLDLGATADETLNLNNTGSAALTFEIIENDRGFHPIAGVPGYVPPATDGGSAQGLSQSASPDVNGKTRPESIQEQEILLNQPPNTVNGLFADSDCALCGTGQQSIAENFYLPDGGMVGQIVFWTGYFPADVPQEPDAITVIFHADAAGTPGTAIYTQDNVDYTREQTGVILFGVHEWMHILTLASPVSLDPGNYWVEIFNHTTGNSDQFFWETGNLDPVNGAVGSAWTTATPGVAWNYDGATNLAIQLIAGSGDVPWISEAPISGTIDVESTVPVIVSFDASVVNQPGDYYADLKLKNDTPYGMVTVPVTMTVLAPATWGKLDGTVTDLCTGALLEEVLVDIPLGVPITQTMTNAEGYYSLWLEANTYDVNYSLDGYISASANLEILPNGQVTTNDVMLVPDKPCITVEPDAIEAWVLTNTVQYDTGGLTIGNIGAQPLDWEIREKAGGFAPPGVQRNTIPPEPLPAVDNPGSSSFVGMTSSGTPIEGGQIDAWFNAAPMPGAGVVRYAHAQCPGDTTNFYIIAGVENGTIVNNTQKYDASTNSWTTLAPIPQGSEGPTATCFEDKIYVVGGAPFGVPTGDMYIYDIASDSWSTGASVARTVWGAAMGAYEGTLYYVGGDFDFYGGGTSNQVDIYDIATDTWTGIGSSMPTPRSTPGYFQLGEFLYVVGGWGDSSPGSNSSANERYDMSSDTWEVGPAFTIAKGDFALAGTSLNLYAIGGDANGGAWFDANAAVWVYDWTQWPGGAWADLADPILVGVTANNGGFATDAVTGGEIWTTAGIDINFSWRNDNVYRPSEPPWTPVPVDVPWVWEVPVSGTVDVNDSMPVDVFFTSISGTVPLDLGTYTATLRIINNDAVAGIQNVPVTMHVVEEYLPPVVSFTSNSPVMLGTAMEFANTSDRGIPPANEFEWNFGDGVTETLDFAESVSHMYGTIGVFTVSVTACNVVGCDTATAQVEVWGTPYPSFTSNSPVMLGETMEFTNTTVPGFPVLTDYVWDFGDGITSTLVSPTHLYTDFGTFTVVLTACNEAGCSEFSADVEVTVVAPVVSFTSNSPVVLGTAMLFTNTSDVGVPPATDFVWDFGDGVTETLGFADPVSHVYAALGTYTVVLEACNVAGCDDFTADVEVVGTAPLVSFTSNSPVPLGDPMVFTNTSDPGVPAATDFVWDFGDGVTETLGLGDAVSHVYAAAGTYTVTIEACNSVGCDTFSADVVVFIEQWNIFLPVINRH